MDSGRRIARHTLFNLLGQGAPLLAALVAIPLLIQGLGMDRFGVLSLVWIVVGYFSLFDLGLGRALTHFVAEKIGAGREEEVPDGVWTALLLMLLLGVAGTLLLLPLAPWLAERVLNVPVEIQVETARAFALLVLSLPVIITTAGLRGVLEAKQEFGLVNAIRLPLGVFLFLGPLLVLPFSSSLVPVVAVTLAGRLVAWVAHLHYCLRVVPGLRRRPVLRRALVWRLLRFGGWMTVSNLVSPLMVYLDRFLIGALLTLSAVVYYVTPYEVVTKLWIITGALAAVLFPAFAAASAQDAARSVALFDRGRKAVLVVLFPITLVLVTLAGEGLSLWLGADFARQSTFVLQWLAIGVFLSSIAAIPFNALLGAGRADLVAKLHLIELPFYLAAAWWLIGAYGIQGAAIAWVARIAVDAIIMLAMAERVLAGSRAVVRRCSLDTGAALLVLAGAALAPIGMPAKGAFLLVAATLFTLATWFLVFDEADRHSVQRLLAAVRGGAA